MNLPGGPPPTLISKPAALKQAVDLLRQEPIVAVDTESNSLFAYREQVCLIQFSTPALDMLVDPLALGDLSLLEPVFSDPAIEKVFHAAEYDLLCLKRDFDIYCANLFDTMIAASTLGKPEVGLGNLLEAEFGVQMNKQYQRANWGQRPLPPDLLAYARLDTHYLIRLRERLKRELEAVGRLTLAEEEFNRLCLAAQRNPNGLPKSSNEQCWRISGSTDLEPQQAAVLLELCRYRDQAAAAQNRPLFKVIGDATLLAIAGALPKSLDALRRIPGMSPGQIQRHGRSLLQAVQRGLQAAPVHPPRTRRPDEQFLTRLEDLRQWRKNAANALGVKSDVILSREVMFAIAEQNPCNWSELAAIMADVPWRLDHYGKEILKAIGGRG